MHGSKSKAKKKSATAAKLIAVIITHRLQIIRNPKRTYICMYVCVSICLSNRYERIDTVELMSGYVSQGVWMKARMSYELPGWLTKSMKMKMPAGLLTRQCQKVESTDTTLLTPGTAGTQVHTRCPFVWGKKCWSSAEREM